MKYFLIGLIGFYCCAFTLINSDKKDTAVLIGITHYDNSKPLKYSDDDTYRMFAFLKSLNLKDEAISISVDEDATKKNIIKNIKTQIEKSYDMNNFILFYSGQTYSNGILTSENDSISYQSIVKVLEKSRAKNNFIIIEGNYDESVENLISKNTAFWFSADEGQEIIENDNLKQHIFSHFLIRGLKGAADTNKNSTISLVELEKYVSNNVKDYTNHSQTPKLINTLPIEWKK